MSLITCRMCGNDMRSGVRACPNCGALQPGTMAIDYFIILMVVIFLSITLINTHAVQGSHNGIAVSADQALNGSHVKSE